ncbi:MAG: DUF58 domain-containing protein [Pseudomonadota bacterium]
MTDKRQTTPSTDAAVKSGAEAAAEGFPALLLEAETVAHTVAAGAHGRRKAGPGESFWQHRPYAFGDPVSAIDWRQSARASDRLYVRQNEWAASASAWFWRDPSQSLDFRSDKALPTKRRRADVLTLALAILLAKAGERIGLIGGRSDPYHGRLAPELLLQALHTDDYDNAARLQPRRIREGAAVIVVSDFYDDPDALEAAAASYAAQGAKGVLLQIIDPAEAVFPYAGRTEFEDLESPARLLFGDAGAVRDRYLEAFAALETNLKTTARRLGWAFIRHRTDATASDGLFALTSVLNDQTFQAAPGTATPAAQKRGA